jgi:hypothetical protein
MILLNISFIESFCQIPFSPLFPIIPAKSRPKLFISFFLLLDRRKGVRGLDRRVIYVGGGENEKGFAAFLLQTL